MAESAYFLALFSGFFYLAVAFPPFRLSAWSDRVLGSLELPTIGVIWIAFFPPTLYRRWMGGTATAEIGGED